MSKESDSASENPTNQIRWTIHETNSELVEEMRSKLSEVMDPELGLNVIELGLIRDFSLEKGTGRLKMVLTTPFCPYGPAMINEIREKAEIAFKGAVAIEMLPDIWNPGMMEDPSALDWGF